MANRKLEFVYMGIRESSTGKIVHCYKDVKNGEVVLFPSKLYTQHTIGLVYSVIKVSEGTYKLDKKNFEPVTKWTSLTDVAEWMREETNTKEKRKASREKSKRLSLARKAALQLRPIYRRAGIVDQYDMIRVIIEELESG